MELPGAGMEEIPEPVPEFWIDPAVSSGSGDRQGFGPLVVDGVRRCASSAIKSRVGRRSWFRGDPGRRGTAQTWLTRQWWSFAGWRSSTRDRGDGTRRVAVLVLEANAGIAAFDGDDEAPLSSGHRRHWPRRCLMYTTGCRPSG